MSFFDKVKEFFASGEDNVEETEKTEQPVEQSEETLPATPVETAIPEQPSAEELAEQKTKQAMADENARQEIKKDIEDAPETPKIEKQDSAM
ncbi:MAG: hypothetical protein Q8Q23_06505 [bacterium]|nr:hypothetical protein [bacterium]